MSEDIHIQDIGGEDLDDIMRRIGFIDGDSPPVVSSDDSFVVSPLQTPVATPPPDRPVTEQANVNGDVLSPNDFAPLNVRRTTYTPTRSINVGLDIDRPRNSESTMMGLMSMIMIAVTIIVLAVALTRIKSGIAVSMIWAMIFLFFILFFDVYGRTF